MKKKKLWAVLLWAVLLTCTACGNQSTQEMKESKSTGDTEKETVNTDKASAEADQLEVVLNVWVAPALVSEEEQKMKQEDWYVSRVAKKFEEGGSVLGYPVSGNEVCGQLYNRTILTEAGLDFDQNPPQTLDEFVQAMGKIQEAGYLPIAAGDDGWNCAYFYGFASLWAQKQGNALVA